MYSSLQQQDRASSPVAVVERYPLKKAESWTGSEQLSNLGLYTQAGETASPETNPPRQTGLPDYKPLPLRWPFLVTMITVMLGLIAALETACRLLPAEVDRDVVPGSGSESSTTGLASITPSPGPSMTTIIPNRRRQFQNGSTTSDVSAPVTPTPTATLTTQPDDDSSSEAKSTETQTTTRVRIGDAPHFGQPGYHTETITLSTEPASSSQPVLFQPLPEQHGHEGPVTVTSTIPTEVVTTITKQTTLPGVVTTITKQTTSVIRTLDGPVSEYTLTSTLHGAIVGVVSREAPR